MMLRCSRKYDIKTDSVVYANNQPYTRENYRSASVGDSADSLFNFCRNLCILKVDNAEYSLITAIVIFSGKHVATQQANDDRDDERGAKSSGARLRLDFATASSRPRGSPSTAF